MPLTDFQRAVCRLIAANRLEQGESYVAGGAVLNTLLPGGRVSRDIDLFHDTHEALLATWAQDRRLLLSNGYEVDVVRERDFFIEAVVRRREDSVVLQWARDSAYRFFPLVTHEDFGLVLHPFDLATNKVLALVGRLEPRDWVDVIVCSEKLQPLGCLAWAACGKDPGFSPKMILGEARRTCRYSAEELAGLAFQGEPPDAAALSVRWRAIVEEADDMVDLLPAEHVGKCVMDPGGKLFRGTTDDLRSAIGGKRLAFHAGSIRGAWPTISV